MALDLHLENPDSFSAVTRMSLNGIQSKLLLCSSKNTTFYVGVGTPIPSSENAHVSIHIPCCTIMTM